MISGLREYDFGDWEGKTAKQLENDEQFKLWLSDSSKYSPPGGENNQEFFKRVTASFTSLVNGIMQASIKNSAIVTHSGVINTILAVYGIPRAKPNEWIVKSGYGYSVRFSAQMWMRDQVFEIFEKLPN